MTAIQETISIQTLDPTFSGNRKKFPTTLGTGYTSIVNYATLSLPSSGEHRNNSSLIPTVNYNINDVAVRFEPASQITTLGFKFLYDPANLNVRSFGIFYNNNGSTATSVNGTITITSSPQFNATNPWYISMYKNNSGTASTEYTKPYYVFFLQSDTNNDASTLVIKYNIFPPNPNVTGYYTYYDLINDENVIVTDSNYRSVYQIINYTNSVNSIVGFEKLSGGPFLPSTGSISENNILTAYFNNQSPGYYSDGTQIHNLISGGEPHITPIFGDMYLLKNTEGFFRLLDTKTNLGCRFVINAETFFLTKDKVTGKEYLDSYDIWGGYTFFKSFIFIHYDDNKEVNNIEYIKIDLETDKITRSESSTFCNIVSESKNGLFRYSHNVYWGATEHAKDYRITFQSPVYGFIDILVTVDRSIEWNRNHITHNIEKLPYLENFDGALICEESQKEINDLFN